MSKDIYYSHYIVVRGGDSYEELKKYLPYLLDNGKGRSYFDSYIEFFIRGYSEFREDYPFPTTRGAIIYFNKDADEYDIGWDTYSDLHIKSSMVEYKSPREWILDVPEARIKLLKDETKVAEVM